MTFSVRITLIVRDLIDTYRAGTNSSRWTTTSSMSNSLSNLMTNSSGSINLTMANKLCQRSVRMTTILIRKNLKTFAMIIIIITSRVRSMRILVFRKRKGSSFTATRWLLPIRFSMECGTTSVLERRTTVWAPQRGRLTIYPRKSSLRALLRIWGVLA